MTAGTALLLVGIMTACTAPSLDSASSNFGGDRSAANTKKRASGSGQAASAEEGAGSQDKCTTDAQCGDETICVRGACIDGCRDDDGCSGGLTCMNRKCAEPRAVTSPDPGGCTKDADCPLTRICEAGACVLGCHTEFDCLEEQQCSTGGQCEQKTSTATDPEDGTTSISSGAAGDPCTEDVECVLDTICFLDECTLGCNTDGDCSGTKTCSATTLLCE